MRILSSMICTSVWRLPRCQASRTQSSALPAEISTSFSRSPATSTIAPSSSTSPSPSRKLTGFAKSSRNSVPFSAVSTMRRRLRSPASSTTRSIALWALHWPAGLMVTTRCIIACHAREGGHPVIANACIISLKPAFTGSPTSRGRQSEKKIPLRHRQHLGGCAGEQLAVGAHLVGFRIDLDVGRGVVVDHAFLVDRARLLDRDELLVDAESVAQIAARRRLRHEHQRTRRARLAESAE